MWDVGHWRYAYLLGHVSLNMGRPLHVGQIPTLIAVCDGMSARISVGGNLAAGFWLRHFDLAYRRFTGPWPALAVSIVLTQDLRLLYVCTLCVPTQMLTGRAREHGLFKSLRETLIHYRVCRWNKLCHVCIAYTSVRTGKGAIRALPHVCIFPEFWWYLGTKMMFTIDRTSNNPLGSPWNMRIDIYEAKLRYINLQ